MTYVVAIAFVFVAVFVVGGVAISASAGVAIAFTGRRGNSTRIINHNINIRIQYIIFGPLR